MIGMMYLVLTAMLAMNVSAEVLNAFGQFETRLSQTLKSFSSKNDYTEMLFQRAMVENPERITPWMNKSQDVRERTKKMIRDIEDIKIEIVRQGDGPDALAVENNEVHAEHLINISNLDAASHVMMNLGKGKELREKIEGFKKHLLSMVGASETALINNINATLNTNQVMGHGGELKDWEEGCFADMPLIAAVPLLTKIQVDMVSMETELMEYFLRQTDMGIVKIDNFEPIILSQSDYVIKGGEFSAQMFLAATDKTLKPEVIVGGQRLQVVAGKGIYKVSANQVGEHTITGSISLNNKPYPFTYKYTVAEPNVVISPSKMNVLYRGVENPVDVSAAGIPTHMVHLSATNGKLTQAGSGYTIVPSDGNECHISVVADIQGVRTDMGKRIFRVKAVPIPSPEIDGVRGKIATKSQLLAAQGIRAVMPADFDFDLRFTVQSFVVFASIDGYVREEKANGQMFTDKQRQIMQKISSGQRLSITDIKAVGPSGVVDLPDLSIKLQ
ncbi:gliding motility protein GldM [Bacteroidia bacterium]|nr:gliding motility protein GldM [Bacteroidia bacterium]